MKDLPLFILAGIDRNDFFAEKRILQLNFQNKKIIQYLIDEARRSGRFSNIYLVGDKRLKKNFQEKCLFIEAKKYLRQNIKIIFNFFKKEKDFSVKQIAILLSDILPSAEAINEVFTKRGEFLEKNLIFLITPSDNLRKKRGKIFLKKDDKASVKVYSGPGGFYILKPAQLNQKLICSLLNLRMPRKVRKIEVVNNKIYFTALKSFRGFFFFVWLFLKTLFYSFIFIDKVFLFLKTFLKHQKRKLTIKESEIILDKIFVNKKNRRKKELSSQIEIIENPVFVEDIDSEEDIFLLKSKN